MRWLLITVLALLVSGCAKSSIDLLPEAVQSERILVTSAKKNYTLNYLLYLPEGYHTEKEYKWPLLIFLHGMGERGSDIGKVKMHGPPKLIDEGAEFPMVIVSPQCPDDQIWDADALEALVLHLKDDLHVDRKRIYLTGLSMGGYGACDLAAYRPDLFAALAPICGGGQPHLACRLKNIPTWVFHGAMDTVVAPEESEVMVQAMRECGAENVRFTLYPDAAHDSWTKTYENEEFWQWLLAQERY